MLENIELVHIVNKGGDLNYILKEISNFYDINTKRSFNTHKFIQNYFGVLLESFNINSTKIYVDEDLLTVDKNVGAYHYLGDIYINSAIFKKPSEFFADLLMLTHEFQHLVDYDNTYKIVRKVGENNMRLKITHSVDALIDLGLMNRDNYNITYTTNECEYGAEMFAYNYILEMIEKSKRVIKQDSIELQLLKLNSERLKNSKLLKEIIYEKYTNDYMPIIIEQVKQGQAKYYLNYKELVEASLKTKDKNRKEELITYALKTLNKLYFSFSIYENFEILNKFKKLTHKFSEKNPAVALMYIELLNYFNYVVTKEDIQDLTKTFDSLKMSIGLSEINLDKQNLIENILKTKFKHYDKNFEKYTNIKTINDYKNLITTYKTFKKQKHKDLFLQNEKTL